jgi:nicotinate-nucleotide--dimethylbenzimidazole phosphoribosyltransferase
MVTEESIRARLAALAKPDRSLGRLEDLAVRLASCAGSERPLTKPRRLLIFAADHGVVAEGVGIWPAEITQAMLKVIADGRACSSALAAACSAEVRLIDVGSRASDVPRTQIYQDQRVARSTRNLALEPAMTPDEFRQAWHVGQTAVAEAIADGIQLLAVGEIGIGNTTPAACLVALLSGADPSSVIGPGAGATPHTLARKRDVVATAVCAAQEHLAHDPIRAIAHVAGFEIVAIAGAIAASRSAGLPVVLDGVVTGAAAMIARTIDPAAMETAIASHVSAEPAHAVALEWLGLAPFLNWELRLGEGTGALLLVPMLDAAAALLTNVATLDEVTG